ncbi:NAD(P)-binding protein [Rozella allomycis CSF55]|uniref:NAD(P)-binding domain-containing protein n=1 Tax=Rozella allomycis (strain CSF55) TaxID=988480 RepID=A0A075AQK2_ROZAC|nr:NAD(P)-binding domain-containing protein [Rozella allomycis CSF55]RKP18906.1 NAD(P)-binding protein [Rozella allomycis CSF55]|eukprot:EPZ32445.1 NAD(P)-binding domain-containing protein [Rozella allomycis CSF55]
MTIKVCVTSSEGQTGHYTLDYLQKNYKDKFDVVPAVYDEEKAESKWKISQTGLTTIKVDADKKETYLEAFKSCEAVFLVPSSAENKVEHGRNMIDACHEADVKFVLLLSMIGTEEEDYLFGKQFKELEEYLFKSGIRQHCVIRSNFYAENLLLYKDSVMKGELPLPIHDGAMSPVSVKDIGKLACHILNDWNSHIGRAYNITGPECINGHQIASQFSKALGKDIKYVDISESDAEVLLKDQNVPPHEIRGLLEFYKLVKNNQMNVISRDFANLTGDQPKSIKEVVEDNKDVFHAREE